jgi:hypothetical protein
MLKTGDSPAVTPYTRLGQSQLILKAWIELGLVMSEILEAWLEIGLA